MQCLPALAGKLESALEAVLLSDGYLHEHLVQRYGFNIHRVRYAKDRRSVFILWDATPGKAKVRLAAAAALTEWGQLFSKI